MAITGAECHKVLFADSLAGRTKAQKKTGTYCRAGASFSTARFLALAVTPRAENLTASVYHGCVSHTYDDISFQSIKSKASFRDIFPITGGYLVWCSFLVSAVDSGDSGGEMYFPTSR